MSDIYQSKVNWQKALFYLEQPRRFFTERNDYSGLLAVLDCERGIYVRQGNWRKMFDSVKEMWNIYTIAGSPAYLRTRAYPTWEQFWLGQYAELEREYRAILEVARSLQDQLFIVSSLRDLALSLGLQGQFAEALAVAEEGLILSRSYGDTGVFAALIIYGIICLKCGMLDGAEEFLTQAIAEAQKLHIRLDSAPLFLASLYEVQKDFEKAKHFYQLSHAETHPLGRNYFECGALTGLMRVKHAQNDYTDILPLEIEASRLAQQYEYNDYFTSLYLTRGHISWDGHISQWESGFDPALHYYQHTLIHALRFNRFLLDEVLSGREQGTPLKPIIPQCVEHGKVGMQMLVALRKWWQRGMNDIGTPRPDTISPLPEGISLMEAERIARQREPGDGSAQTGVVEQINGALTMANGG